MEPRKTSTLGLVWVASVVIQFGFGAYGVIVTKFAKNNNADPLIFCLYRDGGCFPVLFLAALVAEKEIKIPKKRELPIFIILGFFGMFMNQLFYILGVYNTSADIASMFQPIVPVWTVIIAVLVKIEPLPNITKLNGILKVLGILLAVIGAIITTFEMKNEHEKDKRTKENSDSKLTFGYISLLINTFSMGLYAVIQKRYIFNDVNSNWRTSPICVTAWAYLFGFIAMALASLYYVFTDQTEKFRSISGASVFPLIYAIFISSALCYMLITWCNMLVSASIVTAFWPLQVLFCVILAYFLLGEMLSVLEIVGGLLIILALLAVVWSNYREEKEKKAVKEDSDSESEEKLLTN